MLEEKDKFIKNISKNEAVINKINKQIKEINQKYIKIAKEILIAVNIWIPISNKRPSIRK